MDKDNCLVKVQGEDGKVFDMLILKEFDYKNKKYAVLTEIDSCMCGCHDECDCGDEDCHCADECGCHEEDHECNCRHDDEPTLCLLEITTDSEGNELFKSIDDEKMFNELVEEADRILYKD